MNFLRLVFFSSLLSSSILAEKIKCNYYSGAISYEESKYNHEFDACKTSEGLMYKIIGLDVWKKKRQVRSGVTELILKNVKINEDEAEIKISKNSKIKAKVTKKSKKDIKKQTTGQKKVLALRAIASDAQTSSTESKISDEIFGTDSDPYNLKSQYAACSYGALAMDEYVGTTSSGVFVNNGVYTVQITRRVVRRNVFNIFNSMFISAESDLGNMNQFDYIMYCVPPGSVADGSDSWIAFAYIGGFESVYNDDYCLFPVVQLHELGHNLGMFHSGEPGEQGGLEEYADHSCNMGNPNWGDDFPVMCFNGAKSFYLGWYPGAYATINVNSLSELSLQLIGVANYQEMGADQRIVLKLQGGLSGQDYYIAYNHATGISSGTLDGINQVVITRAESSASFAEQSWIVAKLDSGEVTTLDDFSSRVTITVGAISTSPTGFAEVTVTRGASAPTSAPVPRTPSIECDLPLFAVEIDVFTDLYPTETSWVIYDFDTGATLMSKTNFISSSTLHSDAECLTAPGVFIFEIFDTFGDGICCLLGDGYYEIYIDGALLADGGVFDMNEAWRITVTLDSEGNELNSTVVRESRKKNKKKSKKKNKKRDKKTKNAT